MMSPSVEARTPRRSGGGSGVTSCGSWASWAAASARAKPIRGSVPGRDPLVVSVAAAAPVRRRARLGLAETGGSMTEADVLQLRNQSPL